MTYTVVTTFSPKGYTEYGKKMLETFSELWPTEVELWVYCEKRPPAYPHVKYLDLFESCPDLLRFIERNKKNPKDQSYVLQKTRSNSLYWSIAQAGIRFSFKVYTLLHALEHAKTDFVIWIDADTITEKPITKELLEQICSEQALLSYLGRDNLYPETGFVAYNKNHPQIHEFATALKKMYDTDALYNNSQFHDCVSLEVVMNEFSKKGATFYDIARDNGVHTNNPFKHSILGNYMRHNKGRRRITILEKAGYYLAQLTKLRQ